MNDVARGSGVAPQSPDAATLLIESLEDLSFSIDNDVCLDAERAVFVLGEAVKVVRAAAPLPDTAAPTEANDG